MKSSWKRIIGRIMKVFEIINEGDKSLADLASWSSDRPRKLVSYVDVPPEKTDIKKRRRGSASPRDPDEHREYMRDYYRNLSPEKREARKEMRSQQYADMPDSKKEAYIKRQMANQQAKLAGMSDEEKEALKAKRREQHKKRMAAMSPEERAAKRAKDRAKYQKRKASKMSK